MMLRRIVWAAVVGGMLVGGVLLHRKRLEAANRALEQMVVEAREKSEAGDRDAAARLLEEYLASRPGDTPVRRQHAVLVLERMPRTGLSPREKAAALQVLENALLADPSDMSLRLEFARRLVGMQEFDTALDHLRILQGQIAEASPDQAVGKPPAAGDASVVPSIDTQMIEVLVADALLGTGQYREASLALGRAVHFDVVSRTFTQSPSARSGGALPGAPRRSLTDAFMKLASVLRDEFGDARSAVLVLERAALENPDAIGVWLALAMYRYFDLKDLPGAKAAVVQATAVAPDDSIVLYANFCMASAENQPDKAAAAVARGRELHPDSDWVHAAAAASALRAHDPVGAIDALVEGLTKVGPRPALLQPLVDLPHTAEVSSTLTARAAELRALVPQENSFFPMLEARLLLAAGKPFDAKRILEQVRPLVAKTRGAVASVDVALGHCHRQLGEFDLELTAFERALTVAHDSVAALVGVAGALAASGRDTEALARYREAALAAQPAVLAAMPEIWRPLVQLESAAISKRLAARPDWTPVEALARSLEACPQLGPTGSAVLRAEVLAGKGLHEDACLMLEEAAAAAPLDVVLQSARLVMSAKTGDAARVDTVLGSLPDQLRDDPTILRAEADAAGLMPLPGAGHVFADVEERGVAAPSDDDALDILSALFSCALADGRHHDAFRIADRMVQRCPRSPRAALALVAIGRVARDGATLHRAAGLLEGDLAGASTEARYAKAASMLQDVLDDRQTARVDKQRLRDIRNLLAEVEQSRPNWTAGLSLAGDLDGAEGKDDDAARQYAEALRQCPDDVTIVRRLVRLHMRRRQFADARRVLSELDDVGRARLARYAAEIESREGKSREAVAIAARAVETQRGDVDDLVWCADLLESQGRSEEAVRALRVATRRAPEALVPWLRLMSLQAARYGGGVLDETLAEAIPAVSVEYQGLVQAEAARLRGRTDEAVEGFCRVAAATRGSPLALRYAAQGLLLAGHDDRAKAALLELVAAKATCDQETEARAWARRALVRLTTKDTPYPVFSRELSILKRTAGSVWSDAPDDAALAVSLLAERPEPVCWRDAIVILDELDKQGDLTVEQRLQRVKLRDRVGDWANCRQEVAELAADVDLQPESRMTITRLFLDHGDVSAAEPLLAAVLAESPHVPEAIALASRMLLVRGDRAAAVEEARRLMPDSDDADVATLIGRARLLDDLGFRRAADTLLQRAASRSADAQAIRIAALIRRGLAEEALASIESAWDETAVDASLQQLSGLLTARTAIVNDDLCGRVDRLCDKARAFAADSPELSLVLAELRLVQERRGEAEQILRSLLDREGLTAGHRTRATAALVVCLACEPISRDVDRVIGAAIQAIGPVPVLLDARAMSRLSRGEAADALRDCREAALAPSPQRLLHLAKALAETDDLDGAGVVLTRAFEHALVPDALRQPEKQWCEALQQKIGLAPMP